MEKEISTILQNLREFKKIIGDNHEFGTHLDKLNELIRDAEEPLLIMIMGEFSTGKSTFINALVGKEIAAMNATPTTAVITKLCYGNEDEIIVHFLDGTTSQKNSNDFARLTAEADEESNKLHEAIDYVERRMPLEVLKSITIIDSPGLNAIKSAHGAATRRFMDKADTVLWMFSIENAGSQTEINAMEELSPRLKPLALVNKMDQVDEEEDDPEELLDNLRGLLGDRVQAVIGISAQLALQGKLQKDDDLLAESCIKEFYDIIQREVIPNRDTYKMNTLLDEMTHFSFDIGKQIEDKEQEFEKIKESDYSLYIEQKSDLAPIKDGFEDLAVVFHNYCKNQWKNLIADVFMGVLYRFGLVVEKNEEKAVKYIEKAAIRHNKNAQIVLMMHYMYAKDYDKSLFWARHGAKDGNDDCQAVLGLMLLHGIGTESNPKEALKYFKLASAQGNSTGQHHEGFMYLYGLDVDRDVNYAFKMLNKSALQGEGDSLYELGECYQYGWGTEQNQTKAFEYYNKAVDKGSEDAVLQLGLCYAEGIGTEENIKKALEYLNCAAERGDGASLIYLANLYSNGEKVPKDDAKAFSLLKKAAEKEVAEAQYRLSVSYHEGIGTSVDYRESQKWHQKAVENEYPLALWRQYVYLRDGTGVEKDENEALKMLEKAAASGIAEIKLEYADCLNYGYLSGIVNKEKAIEIYTEEIAKGNPRAKFDMALLYENGDGISKDEAKYVELIQEAASDEYASAQCRLGLEYMYGDILAKDEKKGCSLLEAAAKQDDYIAKYHLGCFYTYNNETEADIPRGIKMIEESAKSGYSEAQLEMGLLYYNGHGVTEDDHKAFYWLEKAAMQNNAEAARRVALFYRDGKVIARDDNAAFKNMLSAAENGDVTAANYLGIYYSNGIGTAKDDSKAFYWFRRSAEQGFSWGKYNLALCYKDGSGTSFKNYEQAFKLFVEAEQDGISEAYVEIGEFYEKGMGVQKDTKRAFEYYNKAAEYEEDDGEGAYNYGRCYENGIGINTDENEAIKWYQKAISRGNNLAKDALEKLQMRIRTKEMVKGLESRAQAGDIVAFYEIGKTYENSSEYEKALEYYLRAAVMGHIPSMLSVGMYYCNSSSFEEQQKGCQWFLNAAKSESPEGQYWYGKCLIDGVGIKKDEFNGKVWLQGASKKGYQPADTLLAELSRKNNTSSSEGCGGCGCILVVFIIVILLKAIIR